jgi:hypothetical protein
VRTLLRPSAGLCDCQWNRWAWEVVGLSESSAGRIFISYRRQETAWPAGRLYDVLVEHFRPEQVFKDVDNIEPGDEFVERISAAVGSCDVLLALIGPQWLTMTDENGQRRLDNPDDYVRLEIETALTRKIRVIPILVDEARIPRANELPATLAPLVRRNAVEINPITFDTKRLIATVQKTLTELKVSDTTTGSAAPTSEADRANQQVGEPEVERLMADSPDAPRAEKPSAGGQPATAPASATPQRKRNLRAWQAYLLGALVGGACAVVIVVVLALIAPYNPSEPQPDPSPTRSVFVTMSGVRISTKAKTITYNVEGTHGGLLLPYEEIRLVGQRREGEWLVSAPATLGPSTWQAFLSTTYRERIVLKAVIIQPRPLPAQPGCDTCPKFVDPGKPLAKDGWDYEGVRVASAEQTVKPR